MVLVQIQSLQLGQQRYQQIQLRHAPHFQPSLFIALQACQPFGYIGFHHEWR